MKTALLARGWTYGHLLYWWQGTTMSRVPGEQDRVLFKVQGMNIRRFGSIEHPERRPGIHFVSRR